MGKERDHKDAAQDIARDLAEIASHIGQLEGDVRAYLSDPNYNTLKLRLEAAHSALEAAARRGDSSPFGSGLCRIPRADFREEVLYEAR